jgi:hypothetical protein
MHRNLRFLNPRSHNIAQKIGLIIALGLLIALLIAHNPFRGYETSYTTTVITSLPPIKVEIDFLDWRSYGALLRAVDHVSDWLSFSLLIVLFGVAWLWIFQSPTSTNAHSTSSTESVPSRKNEP